MEAPLAPPVVGDSQAALATQDPPQGSQEEDPDSFLHGVSPFQLSFNTQQIAGPVSQAAPAGPELLQDTTEASKETATDPSQLSSSTQQPATSQAGPDNLEDSTLSSLLRAAAYKRTF